MGGGNSSSKKSKTPVKQSRISEQDKAVLVSRYFIKNKRINS
jgi:hypothetical protein